MMAKSRQRTDTRKARRERFEQRTAELAQQVRVMAPPVVIIFDREKSIGSIPENLRRYLDGSAKS
jgi:thioredoxin-related protein